MTRPREVVLSILYEIRKPLGAYEILDFYRQREGSGDAMTIYRALDSLEKARAIHKIHSQNTYKICEDSHEHQHVQIFICQRCKKTTEIDLSELRAAIRDVQLKKGVEIESSILELTGTCVACHTPH